MRKYSKANYKATCRYRKRLKKTGKKYVQFCVTEEENKAIKEFLLTMRNKQNIVVLFLWNYFTK